MSLTLRGIKGSALTHGELDNNFLWLKSKDIVDATLAGTNLVLTKDDTTTFNIDLSAISGVNGGNMWHVPYGYTLTVQDNFQSFIYGDLYIEGTIDLQTNAQLVVLNGDIHISGGSIVGSGTTQVVQLPDFDTKISGLTYSGSVLTVYQNDGSYFDVIINSSTPFTGNTSGDCITDLYVTNLNSCSPLHIQPVNTGDVYISEGGGNVGIGITTPSQTLEVNGNALIKTAYIGTISLFGDNYASFSHNSRNGVNDYSLLSENNGTTYLNTSTGQSIKLRINNIDKVILDSNGNFGIGTITPSETLEVVGKTKTTNFQMTSGSTTDYILTSSDSQGNGKWTPSYNLSTKDYGSFYDTTTQTGGTGTIQSFQLNSSGVTKGISITNLTGITVTHNGIYNIQFSAQIANSVGSPGTVFIWLRKNGIDLPNSNTGVEIGNNNDYYVAAWNFVEQFNSNDVINLMWYSPSTNISISYNATPTVGPAIPSLILTITQI